MSDRQRIAIYSLADSADPGVPRYVGMTRRPLPFRLAGHLLAAEGKQRRGQPFYDWMRSVVVDGRDVQISLLESVPEDADWREAERSHIKRLRDAGASLWNVSSGGDRHSLETKERIARSRIGKKHSAETRAKLSAIHRGRVRGPNPPEWNAKIAAANTGKRHSPETLAKMSASHVGKKAPRTPEWQEKLNTARRGRPGKPHTDESKQRLRDAMNRWHALHEVSAEARAKSGAARRGKPRSEETKAKISAALKGKPRPPRIINQPT